MFVGPVNIHVQPLHPLHKQCICITHVFIVVYDNIEEQ